MAVLAGSVLADTPAQIAAKVEDAARAQLVTQAERAGWREPHWQLTLVPGAQPLPACDDAVTVDTTETRQAARMRFTVRCDAASAWRRDVVVRAEVSAMVVVAQAAVPARQAIPADALGFARRSVVAAPDLLHTLDGVAGASSKRALRAGDALRQSWIVVQRLVKRGDVVRIVAQREQVEVSVNGEALDDGALGAVLRVRNSSTGRVIRARVTGAGTVAPADL